MKYTSKLKKGGGTWGSKPFTIGREGAEFQPSTFGSAHGTEKKSIPNKLHGKHMKAMASGGKRGY